MRRLSSHGSHQGNMEGGSFTADFDIEDNSFTTDSERYVREGSGNGHLSP